MTERSIKTLNDEVIEDLFTEAYEEQVAKWTEIGEFESKCIREPGKDALQVDVTIFGFAGTPTPDDYKAIKYKEMKEVIARREDIVDATFVLKKDGVSILNTNDYVVSYILI